MVGHGGGTEIQELYPPTFDGYNYYMTILDDYTHFTTIYLLKYKSEAGRFLQKFIVESGNELNQKVARIRCDRGGE